MNRELRYVRDFVVVLLGLMLVTGVERGIAAASHLSRDMTAAVATTTVVLGLIGYVVILVRRSWANPQSATARFAPRIINAGLCVLSLYGAFDSIAEPGGRSVQVDMVALKLVIALYLGGLAIPGAGTAIKGAINRLCAGDRQPAPFTPASRRRVILRLSVLLLAVIAFIMLRPQVGVPFALLAAYAGLTLVLIVAERYANLRSPSAMP